MGLFSRRQKIGPLPPKANPYPSRLRKLKKPSALVIAGFFVAVFYSLSWINPPLHQKIEKYLIEAAYSLSSTVTHPFYLAKAFYEDSGQLLELSHVNQALKHENEELKLELLNHAQTLIENQDLKRQVHFLTEDHHNLMTVPILSTPYDGLHYSCIIAGGETSGIRINQVVLSPEGIVGRVNHTTPHAARVLLMTDHTSKTPIFLPRLNLNAIAVGDGSPYPRVTYLENIQDVQDGDEVFTSGFGGIYPRGLYVGRLQKINSVEVRLMPATDVKKMTHLQVIKSEEDLTSEVEILEDAE
ncbi:Cell shape-determining protein MreC [Candidatus Bealeia paramacronuclearis]|uniref:Cell shape-determining protein MreC n=1 Tax=Candidatus Bealeia paramacronuclearis TaxID=1921001 RepID=A0ABZ2C0H6_9PROT|nr:Cell shape-determining protein MreC [Candidatus Bealeia paramacronuclearis]